LDQRRLVQRSDPQPLERDSTAWIEVDTGPEQSIMAVPPTTASIRQNKEVLGPMVIITDDCIECGSCAEVCPEEAISEGDGKYVIDQERCLECLSCLDECPSEAIVEM
jgi:ferredoxin